MCYADGTPLTERHSCGSSVQCLTKFVLHLLGGIRCKKPTEKSIRPFQPLEESGKADDTLGKK